MDFESTNEKIQNFEYTLNLYMNLKEIRTKIYLENDILKSIQTNIFLATDDLIEVLRFESCKIKS